MTYGRSPWIDQFPKSRVPTHPRFRGDRTSDVVIVGGGLTGCATAYACAAAGLKVVLLEADRIPRALRADVALDGIMGMRAKDATIDPYRASVGLAAAAVDRGAIFFERSPVRRVTFTRKTADVHTAGGKIRTRRVVVATGM